MTRNSKTKKTQKYWKQTRSHGVSPEKREKVYGGNDLRKEGF